MSDLISREALKKKFDEYIKANPNISGIFELGKVIINNAPTVEYPFYQEAYQTGYEEGKNERPQGEWYEDQFTSCGSILQMRLNVIQQKCSKCERWSIKWEGTIPSDYCSHCGARMRKGGAENENNGRNQ